MRQRGRERIFCLLTHSPNACNSQSFVRLKRGAWNSKINRNPNIEPAFPRLHDQQIVQKQSWDSETIIWDKDVTNGILATVPSVHLCWSVLKAAQLLPTFHPLQLSAAFCCTWQALQAICPHITFTALGSDPEGMRLLDNGVWSWFLWSEVLGESGWKATGSGIQLGCWVRRNQTPEGSG